MRILKVICLFLLVAILSGCGTTSKIYTFDKDNNPILMEDVDSDIIGSIVQSTKNKSLVVWHTGWAFGLSASPGTMEDPTPTIKIICGKFNDGYIALLKDNATFDWERLAKCIQATNSTLEASATGVKETVK
jgi:hypothetical protein